MNVDKRFFRLIKHNRKAFISTIVLGCLSAAFVVYQSYWLSYIIDASFLKNKQLPELQSSIVALLICIIMRFLVQALGRFSAVTFSSSIRSVLQQRYLAALKQSGPVSIKKYSTSDIITSSVKGIDALDVYFADYLPQLMFAVFIPLLIIGCIFPFDIVSGGVAIFTAPLIPVFMILIGKAAKKRTHEQWENLNAMGRLFFDLLQGLTYLKFRGRSREQEEDIIRVCKEFSTSTLSVLKIAFLSALVLEFLATISVAVVAVSIGLRLMKGYFDFQDALFILVVTPEVFIPLRKLGVLFHTGMEGLVAGQKILAVIEENEVDDESESSIADKSPFNYSITLDNISFGYHKSAPVLKDISIEIPCNKITALVGSSGSGKSTLIHLILRFMKPDHGRILIGSAPVESISEPFLRKTLSYLPQNPYLFNGSIEENLRIANPDATFEMIEEACRKAHIHEFIESLEEGYQTILGEKGTRFSGGQAKRIAVARCFLHDGDILVMDEPTDELDPMTEELIMQSIKELSSGKTVVMIAHRLNTVAQADHIVVIDKTEGYLCGTHETLLQESDLYSMLWKKWSGSNV